MYVKKIKAENFRNIEKCSIEFSPGVNLIHGKNAEGKTNAVEGIYIFSRGKSFRAKEDRELISFGKEGFRISVDYENEDGINTLEYSLFGRCLAGGSVGRFPRSAGQRASQRGNCLYLP